jgi:BirA family biotin operon repressor/biotin-[acetyl-CoA-carboxylase] ligase
MEFRIENLTETDSTNLYLNSLYTNNKAVEGHIITAEYQHAGKGQDQNVWHSETGKNLLMSLLLRPDFLDASSQFLLNQVISIAVKETVSHFLTNKTVCIKWPNDIYIGDMKVAGILIRHFITGSKIDASIAGIGLNIQQEFFPGHIPNPCSLYSVGREMIPVDVVLNVLLDQISHHYENLRCSRIRDIETIYSKSLYRTGKPYEFRIHKKTITATINGTDQYGRLLLTGSDGTAYCCDLKEIEYVI